MSRPPPSIVNPAGPSEAHVRAEIARVRSEINLALERIRGQQNAVNSKRTYLARLEAQLAIAGGSCQPARGIA